MWKKIELTEQETNRTPLEWKIKLRQRVTGGIIGGVLIGVGAMMFILVIAMLAA
jgi:hypothetical protein